MSHSRLHHRSPSSSLSPRTLKEALEGQNLDADALVTVLFGELNAYKSVRGDTGQERYNVLCDLLQICSEHSGRLHQRAVALTELAQLLCHRSYAPHTDWWVLAAVTSCAPKSPSSVRVSSPCCCSVCSLWGVFVPLFQTLRAVLWG